MNKRLVIGVLNAYSIINDGSLTIMIDNHNYNDCKVVEMSEYSVVIKDKDNISHHITIESIIGIQFMDMMAMVGMK